MASTARKKLIIEARVNEYMMRDANPNVPWTPDEIAEAAAAGVPDPLKGETLICACVPKPDVVADEHLAAHLRDSVVKGLGAAFRPRQVIFVSDLPKTRNMKVMRRVVRAVYEGKDPGDLAALVNPEAVAELRDRMAAIRGRAGRA